MRASELLRPALCEAEAIIVLTDEGASAVELSHLRKRFVAEGLAVRSVRTQQLRRALVDTPYASLREACRGPLLLVTTTGSPDRLARVTRDTVSWRHGPISVRACAVPGSRVELSDLLGRPSLAEARASLCELLASMPQLLLDTLADRHHEQVIELDPQRRLIRAADLQALRRRLCVLLEGPPGDREYRSRWMDCRIDVPAIFGRVPGLWLRPGWRLHAYVFRAGYDGNGFIAAMPPELPDPPPLGVVDGSLFEPPRPAGSRPPVDALCGDGSLLSYLYASILLRELSEFGALWHGTGWGDYRLVDALPPGYPWESQRRIPRRLRPGITQRGDEIVVVLWSLCNIGTVRLTRHTDVYAQGSYRPRCTHDVFATGGPGAVH